MALLQSYGAYLDISEARPGVWNPLYFEQAHEEEARLHSSYMPRLLFFLIIGKQFVAKMIKYNCARAVGTSAVKFQLLPVIM